MTTKEKLLALFESSRGVYYSGEEIAKSLNVSRAAVWKAVKALRAEGYCIDAVPNKGYCLSVQSDILSPQGIAKYLDQACENLNVNVLPSVDSTNVHVREKADAGLPEGYTLIASEQTAGKGRYGRYFFSPPETGAYLSLLLRPNRCAAQQALGITTMAAVAMCEAIEAVSDEKPQIKWVNDIFVRGKKVCGILTEGAFGMESGVLEYAVLGVGINVYPPRGGFPEEIEEIAGAIFEKPRADMKNRLVAEFLNRFMAYYTAGNPAEYIGKYRDYSMVIGTEITVISPDGDRRAFACGIDDECRLQVRYEDGQTESLYYGEIRIRM